MNSLEKYISKNAGRTDIYETVALGSQCVALAKHYSENEIGIKLWSFWGSAKTGWENTSNTFSDSLWERIPNDMSKPNQVPNIGDLIFFETGTPYDHVAIVRNAPVWVNKIEVFEQNTGNGDGSWYDDRARVNTYTYNNCLWWYSAKSFYVEYRGVPVNFIEQPASKSWLLGYYWVNTISINITPKGRAKEDFEVLIEHEWSHKIYWADMSKNDVELWERVSQYEWAKTWLQKYMPWKYLFNKYISPWETNESEDFAETWEDTIRNPDIVYNDYRDFKRMVVKKLIEKYT